MSNGEGRPTTEGFRLQLDRSIEDASSGGEVFGTCPRWGFLTAEESEILQEFADKIVIPINDDPGGKGLCAAGLIEAAQLVDEGKLTFNPGVVGIDALKSDLSAINDASKVTFNGTPYHQLTSADRDTLMNSIASGSAAGTEWAALGLGSSSIAQFTVFGTFSAICKGSLTSNYPETKNRNFEDQGKPIFSDPEHLITNVDSLNTRTGYSQLAVRPTTWEVEKLLWTWQAGKKVTGFDGLPIFDATPATTAERLAAKAKLYNLSSRGLA